MFLQGSLAPTIIISTIPKHPSFSSKKNNPGQASSAMSAECARTIIFGIDDMVGRGCYFRLTGIIGGGHKVKQIKEKGYTTPFVSCQILFTGRMRKTPIIQVENWQLQTDEWPLKIMHFHWYRQEKGDVKDHEHDFKVFR